MSELYLFPEEITVEPDFNTRLWPLDEKAQATEDEMIRGLAYSIESQGQLDDCVVVVDPARPLPHVLVIGHRRRRAIASINQRMRAEGKDASLLRKMRCRIDNSEGDPIQKAIHSNVFGKSYSTMETGSLIVHLRRKLKAYGVLGTRMIAEYMALTTPFVNYTEKLYTQSDPATRAALHSGIISPQAANDLLTAVESKRAAILELAVKIQEKSRPSALRYKRGSYYDPMENLRAQNRFVKRTCIIKAIHALDGGERLIPRALTDVRFYLKHKSYDASYGYHSGAMRSLARDFYNWTRGALSDTELDAAWDDVAKTALRGTHTKEDEKEEKRILAKVKALDNIAAKRPVGRPKGKVKRGDKPFDYRKPIQISRDPGLVLE